MSAKSSKSKTSVNVTVSGSGKRPARKSKDLFSGRQKTGKHGRVVRPKGFNASEDYIATLNDPFQCGPVHLGWGTYVPTGLFTAYYSAMFTTNADGSFTVVCSPYCGSSAGRQFFALSNVAQTVAPSPSAVAATNVSSIAGDYSAARCVSLGIKVTPQIAATSPPGMLGAGLISSGSSTHPLVTATNTSAVMFALPTTTRCTANQGIAALWRPVDASSYEYSVNIPINISGGVASNVSSWPYIVGLGLPASTNVWVEVVGNYEGIAGGIATTDLPNMVDTVSDKHANPEDFLKKHSDRLSATFRSIKNTLYEWGPHVKSAMQMASMFFASRDDVNKKQEVRREEEKQAFHLPAKQQTSWDNPAHVGLPGHEVHHTPGPVHSNINDQVSDALRRRAGYGGSLAP